MKTTIYLATADGASIITGADEEWRGDLQLKGKRAQCIAVLPDQPETVFCGTFGDGIFRSGDCGVTWRPCSGFGQPNVTALAAGDRAIYAGTEPSNIFRSGDGETWRELPCLLGLPSAKHWSFPPRPETHHVRFILPDPYAPQRLHVAIEAGALLRSDDGGETWRDRVPASPRDTHTLAIHPKAPGRLYSAAGDGYFESTDDGDVWRRVTDGLRHQYCWSVAVSADDPDTILLTASKNANEAHRSPNSFVYRRSRNEQWAEVHQGLPAWKGRRVAIAAASPTQPGVFYLASEGEVYQSSDQGIRWQRLPVEWPQNEQPAHAAAIAVIEAA